MNKNKAIEIANGYFENHTVDEFHITSDEQAFFTKNDAENHAKSLKDTKVFSVTRGDEATEEASDEETSGPDENK